MTTRLPLVIVLTRLFTISDWRFPIGDLFTLRCCKSAIGNWQSAMLLLFRAHVREEDDVAY
jgi:hypothetical protein